MLKNIESPSINKKYCNLMIERDWWKTGEVKFVCFSVTLKAGLAFTFYVLTKDRADIFSDTEIFL
jgi:hypothetical protein